MAQFRSIAAATYYNAALGASAVELFTKNAVKNLSDAGTPGSRYATHVRVVCAHATQYVGALVADTGDAALSSGNYTCLIAPLGEVIMPLSQAGRVSVIASASSTIVSVEFGTYHP